MLIEQGSVPPRKMQSDGNALIKPDEALTGALVALDQRAESAAEEAIPANTRRAYELDLHAFASWCGRHGVPIVVAKSRRENHSRFRASRQPPLRRGPCWLAR